MKRVYGLDILRAVAILLVLYGHSSAYFGSNSYDWFALGDGVAMFFVLSGYLVGNILLKQMQTRFNFSDLLNFWKRRWLRTLPAYFFVLICLTVYNKHISISHFFFVQNIFKSSSDFFLEAWSLSIEEWFYLLIPFIFLVGLRINKKALPFIIGAIILGVSVYRQLHTNSSYSIVEWNSNIRMAVVTRLDSIMYGVLAAYINLYYPVLWQKLKKFFYAGITLWFVIPMTKNIFGFDHFIALFIFPVQSISVFLMLPFLSGIKSGRGILYKFLTFVSVISYSIYLLNFTTVQNILKIYTVHRWSKEFTALPFIIFLLVSFGGAYLLHGLIEKPFMKLRDKKDSKKDSNLRSKVVKVENSVIINQ